MKSHCRDALSSLCDQRQLDLRAVLLKHVRSYQYPIKQENERAEFDPDLSLMTDDARAIIKEAQAKNVFEAIMHRDEFEGCQKLTIGDLVIPNRSRGYLARLGMFLNSKEVLRMLPNQNLNKEKQSVIPQNEYRLHE